MCSLISIAYDTVYFMIDGKWVAVEPCYKETDNIVLVLNENASTEYERPKGEAVILDDLEEDNE